MHKIPFKQYNVRCICNKSHLGLDFSPIPKIPPHVPVNITNLTHTHKIRKKNPKIVLVQAFRIKDIQQYLLHKMFTVTQ